MSIDSEQIFDLAPLGRVWEFPSDAATALMAEIERRFRDGRLSIYGRRPGRYDRELIRFPLDYRIDWLGDRSPGGDYCAPRAVGLWDLSAPSDKWPTHLGQALYNQTKFEDLAALRSHYASVVDELGFTDGTSQVKDSLTENSSFSISTTGVQATARKGEHLEYSGIISNGIEKSEKRIESPLPIICAIKSLADRLGATEELAWREIKSEAFYGRLPLAGIDDIGRLCRLEPDWISYVAPWGKDDPSPACASVPIGALSPRRPQPLTSDIPGHEGFIAFDRERAIRDRRADEREGRAPRSLPPLRMRGVVVDGEELDDIWTRAEYEFQNPDWSLGNALSWIAYHDPLLICTFESQRDLARKRLYNFPRSRLPKRAMVLSTADGSLLDTLKAGMVTAIRNGTELPSTYWFGKQIWDLEVDLCFRRDEVIGCWPPGDSEASRTTPARCASSKPGDNKAFRHPPSREKPFWPEARAMAREWLIENGYPAPNDGNQAALERYVSKWLEDHGHEAGESTVRRHVASWIKEYREELNG